MSTGIISLFTKRHTHTHTHGNIAAHFWPVINYKHAACSQCIGTSLYTVLRQAAVPNASITSVQRILFIHILATIIIMKKLITCRVMSFGIEEIPKNKTKGIGKLNRSTAHPAHCAIIL